MTTQTTAAAGQVNRSAAEIYDDVFVPALFGQFAPWLADAARIAPGEKVLDVACGTGIAALAALERTGKRGRVDAIDINPGMLDVARRKSGAVGWHEAAAEDLPMGDDGYDVTLCLFALMFLADRTRALREMARVTRPGGRIALMTWESLPRTPGYNELVPLLNEVAGPEAAAALTAPFVLGEPADIRAELSAAGLAPDEMRRITGTARHPSLDAWIDTEIGGWTLADLVTPEQVARIKAVARDRLGHLAAADGTVAFPAPAHLVLLSPA